MADLYTSSLETENERLREALAAAQLELDTYKKESVPLHKNLNAYANTTATQGHTLGSITSSMNMGFCIDDRTSVSDTGFYIHGVKIERSDLEFVTTATKTIQEFSEASLWKKINMMWSLLVTRKTSKKG